MGKAIIDSIKNSKKETNEKEFKSFLNNYFKTRSNTPKTKVEAINPTPINPATIPVLR